MSMNGIRTAAGLAAVGLLVAGCGSATKSGQAAGPTTPPVVTASSSASGSSTPASPASPASSATSGSSQAPSGPKGGPVPAGFVPYSATFVSAGQGWVLGNAPCDSAPCTSIVRTRDGGASWQGIPAPKAPLAELNAPAPGAVGIVRFANQDDGWVAGESLYATHNGGASWTKLVIGPGGGTITALGTAAGRVYASVASCNDRSPASCRQAETVYSAGIGSNSWSAVSPALAGGGDQAAMVVTGSGWYLPLGTGVYHGQGAAAPTRLPNPCPSGSSYGAPSATIAVADASHLDAMCQNGGAAGSAQYQLYGSTDGGRHWARAGGSHLEPSGLYGLADNEHGVLLASVASGGSEILRSTDDGASLPNARITAAGGGLPWADLGFTTSSQAVVVLARTALYLSHDSGATWNPVRF